MTFKSNLVIPGSGEHSGDWKGRRVCRPLCVIDRRYLKITVKIISLYLAEAGPKSWRIQAVSYSDSRVELMRNLMAHAQKPDFIFRLNGRVHLNRRGSQFSRLLAAEVCASALVMLDTPRPEVV